MTLEELGDKGFLVLMDQYNIEIFCCFLRHLPLYSSTFHQTNVEIAQNRSEDNLLISRIQSLHLLLEVDDHDEEEHSVVLTLGKRWVNCAGCLVVITDHGPPSGSCAGFET